MNDIKRLLFKRNKPVLRAFIPITDKGAGDAPYLWDAYLKGKLKGVEEGMDMADFAEYLYEIGQQISELWIVEDYIKGNLEPVAFVFASHDGWTMEPHVIHFDNATPKVIYRTWVAFLKKTRGRGDTGSCLLRLEQDSVNLANRLEAMKLIKWVGKIWQGRPSGDEYLYSTRCNARRHV
ncbi:MAG: hypothetical protein ACR2QW_11495 [bacterium]